MQSLRSIPCCMVLLGVCGSSWPGLSVAQTMPKGRPYPPSAIIKSLTIDPARQSLGDGDNWPITWADDDAQYTVYCDGKGFGGGSGEGSMSLAKITGSPPNIKGENIALTVRPQDGRGRGRAQGQRVAHGRRRSLHVGAEPEQGRHRLQPGVVERPCHRPGRGPTGASRRSAIRSGSMPGRTTRRPRTSTPTCTRPTRPVPTRPRTTSFWPVCRRIGSRTRKRIGSLPGWTTEASRSGRRSSRTASRSSPTPATATAPMWSTTRPSNAICSARPLRGLLGWCGTDVKYLGIFDSPTPWGPWTTVTQIDGWGGEENRFQPQDTEQVDQRGRQEFLSALFLLSRKGRTSSTCNGVRSRLGHDKLEP